MKGFAASFIAGTDAVNNNKKNKYTQPYSIPFICAGELLYIMFTYVHLKHCYFLKEETQEYEAKKHINSFVESKWT